MPAAIVDLDFALPERSLDNCALTGVSTKWTDQQIIEKTGVSQRHVAGPDEFASDFAVQAAQKLLQRRGLAPSEVDYIIYCTQSPDYLLPTTACLIQERLGLPRGSGAVDINLGCSGFVYGLGLAKGLIETGQSSRLLLLCADTYTKYLRPNDLAVRTIFGDGGSACLIENCPGSESIGPFRYGTDGAGKEKLIARPGGWRGTAEHQGAAANPILTMNGPEIFTFASRTVTASVEDLLNTAQLTRDDIDYWVFHQASQVVLEHLRKKLDLPTERFANYLLNYGNTVSSTIPISIKCAVDDGRIKPGMRLALVGFGVGYSWGSCLVRWQ